MVTYQGAANAYDYQLNKIEAHIATLDINDNEFYAAHSAFLASGQQLTYKIKNWLSFIGPTAASSSNTFGCTVSSQSIDYVLATNLGLGYNGQQAFVAGTHGTQSPAFLRFGGGIADVQLQVNGV